MLYLPPFESVQQRLNISGANGKKRVNMAYSDFVSLIKLLLRGVDIDEDWYLKQYPDVAAAVQGGSYKSARHHFIEEGYFEGRKPGELELDETWYMNNYADVAAGVRSGAISSARDHYRDHGYAEGRLPSEF